MFDQIAKGSTLTEGRVADIGITGQVITAIKDLSTTEACAVIEVSGDLVKTPSVDLHFHKDAALSYGLRRVDASFTLLEVIYTCLFWQCRTARLATSPRI